MNCFSRWTQNCMENRTECAFRGEDENAHWYLTRLLDLSTEPTATKETAKIIISAETPPKRRYGTRSHCWGSAKIAININLQSNLIECIFLFSDTSNVRVYYKYYLSSLSCGCVSIRTPEVDFA
jgi:hypothetical protein